MTRPALLHTIAPMRNKLVTLLKVSVTLAGLAYVLSQIPLTEIIGVLHNVHWGWLLLAFGLINVSLVVRAYRWLLLLRGLRIAIPLTRLIRLYYVGAFFNSFLPSGFGGDVVRVLEMGRDVPRSTAVGTVLVDRLTGLMMLFLLALLALPFRPEEFGAELLWIIAGVCLLGVLGGSVVLDGRLVRFAGGRLPAWLSPAGDNSLGRIMQAVHGSGRRAVAGALLVSIFFNLILVGWWTALSYALGFNVPYHYYLLVVPVLSVAMLVPSIAGLGVRETIAPLLLAAGGLSPSEAVALSLLEFVLLRLAGLIGAPLYLQGARQVSAKDGAQEAH